MTLYKKCTEKPCSYLVIDTTFASDNPSHYKKNKIRDEKLQYNINREAAKISALSSGKIDKQEYLTGESSKLKGIERNFHKI